MRSGSRDLFSFLEITDNISEIKTVRETDIVTVETNRKSYVTCWIFSDLEWSWRSRLQFETFQTAITLEI